MLRPFLASFARAVASQSKDEDIARREFILNVLLLGVLALLAAGIAIDVIDRALDNPVDYAENSLPSLILVAVFAFFVGLYALSRLRRVAFASYLLLAAFFALAVHMQYRWGVDVHAALFFHTLVIVMSGILVSTRFAFVATAAVIAAIAVLGTLQETGAIAFNHHWRGELWGTTDTVVAGVIFLLIATVSWLGNREIEKSLARARRSEAELKDERDLLEVRVKERTEELRKAEMETLSQAYRFVEFGRIASGIFHDLVNPLAALSLTIERIAGPRGKGDAADLALLADDVASAKRATLHMQKLLDSMRRHLARESGKELFSLAHALADVAHVLAAYARERQVALRVEAASDRETYGNPVALAQALTNLAANAIESFPPKGGAQGAREVVLSLAREGEGMRLSIRDTGPGIAPDVREKIFEPFFTTKGRTGGIGLGLSLAKRIVEKDFDGTLSVDSSPSGTTFALYLPVREP